MKSSDERLPPILVKPYTESVLPKRAKDRSDIELEKDDQSKIDKPPPSFIVPKTEEVDPSRENERKDNAEPKLM
jgi:hypothetical protein